MGSFILNNKKIHTSFREYLFSPAVYIFFPVAILFHISLELYHRIVFFGYKIPYVLMKDFFIFDRHKISHLNTLQKFNCIYCSYINGLMAYGKEIAGRSERYWCPFKHKDNQPTQPHNHYNKFMDFDFDDDIIKNQIDLRKFK
jgi:hypothetical protein